MLLLDKFCVQIILAVNLEDQKMEDIFLTEKQVAKKYQVSKRTLHNLRKAGKLQNGVQYFFLGKLIRYKSNELQKYFENSSIV